MARPPGERASNPRDPRARIAARPRARGPMRGGPACYRRADSDELALLHSFQLRTTFPQDVLAEARALPADPAGRDLARRLDLRGRRVFTIDGEDAADFDDAISIEARARGAVELGVHIADVTHYVRPGTALDDEALARGTSVYLPDQVLPMLPEELSNGLCSLVEGRPRLACSVLMTFDARGRRRAARVERSVVQSARRATYRGAQAALDGGRGAQARALASLRGDLERLAQWARRQQELRDARGSLRVESRARQLVCDQAGDLVEIVDVPHTFTQELIEETALAANQAVGDLFHARGLPAIYRVHPEKDPAELARVASQLAAHGIRVPRKQRLTGRDIGRMIREARGARNADALIERIMGLLERAVYAVKGEGEVAQHFGLARRAYLHFTSPIRRYPDLLVHRWLWATGEQGAAAEAELRSDALLADLNAVAAHCSTRAEAARMAAQAVADLKVCRFMRPRVGRKFQARVRRAAPAGLEVDLVDLNVSGFLPARLLGARRHAEGDPVTVRVQDVDFQRLQVMLAPA